MDFSLSEEQELLQETVRDLAEIGIAGLAVPEAHGGIGFTWECDVRVGSGARLCSMARTILVRPRPTGGIGTRHVVALPAALYFRSGVRPTLRRRSARARGANGEGNLG